ncbi:Crp/Fnr family transcriptional regulator [Aquibacillus koreensis]|uniref:Crp/Fnr family transcriptional regulator n=1 Tax=Aquibacillus koreensis TaxID=279446 RepID=A0A9X4AHG0_9BACI|nr:Crp/Fnr family transcriptional regulator [Aquibacillus koreensis]MCT2535633.1 Crp/Fnr family transcriptional regulator [Aquibacillus koreensis]MDC3420082.1 Crp/Fnr family transcriptional regulator [Aquibacillus koreensis]
MNSKSIQELLQTFPLFKDLTDDEIQPIIDLAQSRTYRRGTHIFMQGDPLTNVYFIHIGKIKIYKTDFNGKEQIVNVLQSGNMFPHQGFFRQDQCPAHAEVIEDATLIYIPIHLFENFLMNNPAICVKLFKVLGDLIVDLQKRLEEQILHNTYEQIIMLLLRLNRNHGELVKDGKYAIKSNFSNRELANMIGSSRETVSRTLTQLKKENLITTNSKGNIVIDKDALEQELLY